MGPVRGFASFRGQRNWPGWWWFSRTGEHVGYESWAERDVLMALDADPGVEVVASQPMWLHVPDRDSCNLLTLVATMIVNCVQALLLARDRFHPL